MLALAQPGHRRRIAGSHQQLEAAHPLQRQDPARRQQRQGLIELVATGHPAVSRTPVPGPLPLQPGPAGGAADRFGVETAIAGVVKLALAGRAERKARQGGVGAGVGLGRGDRIARPALAAADERVAVAAVGGVVEFGQTGGAGGQIGGKAGGDQAGAQGLGGGSGDAQAGWRRNAGREPLGLQRLQSAGGLQRLGQAPHQPLQRAALPLQLEPYGARHVFHLAHQLQLGGKAMHQRP